MRFDTATLQMIGLNVLSFDNRDISNERVNTIFRSQFGCSLSLVYQLWNLLDTGNLVPVNGLAKHMYWALAYMKTYETYVSYSIKFKVSEKTFRKWIKEFIRAISRIDVVSTVSFLFSKIHS
jgi:hypothetical protein